MTIASNQEGFFIYTDNPETSKQLAKLLSAALCSFTPTQFPDEQSSPLLEMLKTAAIQWDQKHEVMENTIGLSWQNSIPPHALTTDWTNGSYWARHKKNMNEQLVHLLRSCLEAVELARNKEGWTLTKKRQMHDAMHFLHSNLAATIWT